MKDIRNIVKWTSIDEQLHFNIGVLLTNILRKEFPEMFTSDLEEVVHKACLKAIKYESKLLEWVFEKGELQKMSRENLEDYMKFRVNESLDQLGFKKLFENQKSPKELDFFYEEVFADSQDDFFAVRPVDYTLKDIAITGEDLF
jgi:ribonucleoside-diphosphate reductase beta chain